MDLSKDMYFITLDDQVESILTVARFRGPKAIGRKGLMDALVEIGPLDNLNHMPKSRMQLALLLATENQDDGKEWKAELDHLLEANDYFTLALVLNKVDNDEGLMSRLEPIVEDFRKRALVSDDHQETLV